MPGKLKGAAGAFVGAGLASVTLAAFVGLGAGYRQPFAAPEEPPAERPIEVPAEGYVGSGTCRSCHPHEYETWSRSYHRTMTQVAGPTTVIPSFDDVVLEESGRSYRLLRRGDEFRVEMDDPDWNGPPAAAPRVERQVLLTTGSHHFQAFWLATGKGRALSFFEFCYRLDEGRWMPIHDAFLTPPRVRQQAADRRWNTDCNRCHATFGRPRLRDDDGMDTHVAEFGIACEACHGPGSEHVAANRNPARRYGRHLTERPDATVANPEQLLPRLSSQVCGQCHSVNAFHDLAAGIEWSEHGYAYRPGDDLDETRRIVHEGERHFWSDGMVRVSGREYNGLIRSPCYTHGDESKGVLSCMSCHRLHQDRADLRPRTEWSDDQLGAGMRGDDACLQCHDRFADEAELKRHTHHEAASTGSRCYDCHMPYTSWGLLKAIRSHEIDSPTVQASVATGRPNACNLCHLDRSLAWTADYLAEWYETPRPALTNEQQTTAASILWLLKGDAGQRALIAWGMGWEPARRASGSGWMPPYLGQLLVDPYAAVRFRAHRSLLEIPGFEQFEYDFTGPAAERLAASRRVFSRWGARPLDDLPEQTAPLLLGADGELRWNAFSALLVQRDNRPVHLSE